MKIDGVRVRVVFEIYMYVFTALVNHLTIYLEAFENQSD